MEKRVFHTKKRKMADGTIKREVLHELSEKQDSAYNIRYKQRIWQLLMQNLKQIFNLKYNQS